MTMLQTYATPGRRPAIKSTHAMEHDDQNSPRPFTSAFPADNSFDGISRRCRNLPRRCLGFTDDHDATTCIALPHTADFPVAAPYAAGVPDGFRAAIPDDADADHPDYRAIPTIRSATTPCAANSACPCVPAASSIFRGERATAYPAYVARQSAIPAIRTLGMPAACQPLPLIPPTRAGRPHGTGRKAGRQLHQPNYHKIFDWSCWRILLVTVVITAVMYVLCRIILRHADAVPRPQHPETATRRRPKSPQMASITRSSPHRSHPDRRTDMPSGRHARTPSVESDVLARPPKSNRWWRHGATKWTYLGLVSLRSSTRGPSVDPQGHIYLRGTPSRPLTLRLMDFLAVAQGFHREHPDFAGPDGSAPGST